MPVTLAELELYRTFVQTLAADAGIVPVNPSMTLWHYTTGSGLLGILESGAIRTTQVAAVNDSSETVYATRLFREALTSLRDNNREDALMVSFIERVLAESAEMPGMPGHASSKFFVACFSDLEDDINQWLKYGGEHGENGYAIGFLAAGMMQLDQNSALVRVNYDKALHARMAEKTAEATLNFYRDGLNEDRQSDPDRWGREFFDAWDAAIYRLAPTIKDDGFANESELRLIHELQPQDLPFVRFQQKSSLLGMYMDLKAGGWEGLRVPRLPIRQVIVGPARHQGITQKAVETLLAQMGYRGVEVGMSRRALQRP